MKFQKRGAAMISFHWLLVIIAGGAIFILFTLFINTGKQASETSLSVDVLLHFDTIFSSLVTTEKTEATLPSRSELDLEFSCRLTDESVDSSFRLKGGVTKDLDNVVLFSKETVSGKSIFTIAKNFAIPYSTSSILYITDPNVLYVIEGQTQKNRNKIISLLPRNATIIELGVDGIQFISQIDVRDYRDIVLIGVTANSQPFQSLSSVPRLPLTKKSSFYIYHVKSDATDILDEGQITGYSIAINSQTGVNLVQEDTVEYDSDELLAGALFSESISWYKCVKQKLSDKISRVSLILSKRANFLENEYTQTNRICKITYNLVQISLNQTTDDPNSYGERLETIREYNEKLELQSCPLVY